MSLPPAFLDELRARVALAPVVSRRVKLIRAGREWKGNCPFHNEKTPSFYVNDDKGFYHCFGCGAHGDVIKFLTEQEGLGFIEAVKQLAAQAGMEVPSESPEARARAEVADTLHTLTGRAAEWFAAQLRSPAGAEARAYLERRGVSAKMVKDFALGFSPDSRTGLKTALKDAGEDRLVEAGLLGRADNGDTYDRFRGRLMFPIRDRRGRVVGFGGRALGDIQPKYLNSADGPLFDKGRLLYNLDRAGPEARKSGRLVVVEGYMDVIGVAGAGITELVAPLGTAMTEDQLGLAWRFVDEPTLCFDGDGAGQRAALRAALRALPLLAAGKSLRIATLPAGEDPDDLVKRGGPAAFSAVLDAAVPLIDFLWASEIEGIDTSTPERRAAVRERLKGHSAAIADPTIKRLYNAEFDNRFEERFFKRVERPGYTRVKEHWRKQPRPTLTGASRALLATINESRSNVPQIKSILAGLIINPILVDYHRESISALPLGDTVEGRLRDALLAVTAERLDISTPEILDSLEAWSLSEFARRLSRTNRFDRMAYSFTATDFTLATAVRDMEIILSNLITREFLESELQKTTQRLAISNSETDLDIQRALREERDEMVNSMMRLAESRRDD